MFKYLILMKKKTSISRDEFIAHYEERHAPLICDMAGTGRVLYRRNYIVHDDPLFDIDGRKGDAGEFVWDVVTEVGFATRADAEAAKAAALANPENLRRIKEDEASFIEPGSVRMLIVEVRESPLG
ncbi:MAG TPA: EthD domain-containing protein [Sphingobium sp.]